MGLAVDVQYPVTLIADSITRKGKHYIAKAGKKQTLISAKRLLSITKHKSGTCFYVQYMVAGTFPLAGARIIKEKGDMTILETSLGKTYVPTNRLRKNTV